MHLGLTVKLSTRKNCRFTGIKAIRSQSVGLAFQKLNFAAIHEQGQ